MPGDIPEAIEIDITELNIGDSVHVEEIPLGDNIEISADVNFTVLTIVTPKVEEVEEEEDDLGRRRSGGRRRGRRGLRIRRGKLTNSASELC